MKHAFAVAEVNGWVGAVAEAANNGLITPEAAKWLSIHSGDNTRTLISGGKVSGRTLEEFYPTDAPFFDNLEASFNAFKQGYPDNVG